MVKVLVSSARPAGSPVPVEDDELDSESMRELVRRVERWKRGEGRTIAHEELMRELGFGDGARSGG